MENTKYGKRREGRWTPIRAKAQHTKANPNSWETHLMRKRWDIGLLRALSLWIMMMMMMIYIYIYIYIYVCVCVYGHTHAHAHTPHTHMRAHTRAHIHAHAHIHTTYTRAHPQTLMLQAQRYSINSQA